MFSTLLRVGLLPKLYGCLKVNIGTLMKCIKGKTPSHSELCLLMILLHKLETTGKIFSFLKKKLNFIMQMFAYLKSKLSFVRILIHLVISFKGKYKLSARTFSKTGSMLKLSSEYNSQQ